MFIKDSQYAVKAIKTFRGMEGPGLNANLYRGAKKIALITDDGNGGELRVEFLDIDSRQSHRVLYQYQNTFKSRSMTAEEIRMQEYLIEKFKDKPEHLNVYGDITGYVGNLVASTMLVNDTAKALRKHVVVRDNKEKQSYQYKMYYSHEEHDEIETIVKKDFKDYTILNTVPFDKAVELMHEEEIRIRAEMDNRLEEIFPKFEDRL